ncbi:hypothetical protein COCOBI_02-5140 [Coccomyxa sp. Obi]|nr:hypothetical protein COCOBI_02-5140 [Coccomyxa sp. Obi]
MGTKPSHTSAALPAAKAGWCGRYRSTAAVVAAARGAPSGACYKRPALPAAQAGRCGRYRSISGPPWWRALQGHPATNLDDSASANCPLMCHRQAPLEQGCMQQRLRLARRRN